MATKKQVDQPGDVLELFQSPADGQFYWRRKDPENHRILSVGGEGFTKRDHVEQSAERSNSDIPRDRWVWIGVQEEPTE